MYMDDYKRWMEADLEDAALKAELEAIAGDEEEIKEMLRKLEEIRKKRNQGV